MIENLETMNTKLTLTLDQEVIEKAKKYAKGKGRSLSKIVENYLRALSSDTIDPEAETSPIVRSLRGSLKAPKDLDYKEELRKALEEKYL